jgi:hypothetical protein
MRLSIDHATVCAAALEPLQQAFATAGLATDYGGPHGNSVTHMALLGFEDGSYLELIAPLQPGRVDGSPWGKLMLADTGAGAWAVGTADIQDEVARLRAQGIEAHKPEAGSRRRPNGRVLEWETASAGPGATLPFMIQDRTPREWRVQLSLSMQGAGLSGIGGVVLGVKDLAATTALFRRAYAWDAPLLEDHAEFNATIAHFSGTPVMLAASPDKDSWLAERLRNLGEIPAAFLLATSEMTSAAQRFPLWESGHWFGRAMAWFQPNKLHGIRLGVVQK